MQTTTTDATCGVTWRVDGSTRQDDESVRYRQHRCTKKGEHRVHVCRCGATNGHTQGETGGTQ